MSEGSYFKELQDFNWDFSVPKSHYSFHSHFARHVRQVALQRQI
jgi:hypothetical protein